MSGTAGDRSRAGPSETGRPPAGRPAAAARVDCAEPAEACVCVCGARAVAGLWRAGGGESVWRKREREREPAEACVRSAGGGGCD